jgi:glutaredoxin
MRTIPRVLVYSRSGCHLCDVAVETLEKLQKELAGQSPFTVEIQLIDGNPDLESRYGEEVPVTLIDGKVHDFFRVDPERFKKALLLHQ